MRRWRVGSFSMGLTLVLFGVALFMAEIGDGQRVWPVLSKWWAVVPILLGLEILAAGWFSGDAASPIRYDFFGIVVAVFVAAVGLALHGLNVSGVLPAMQRQFTAVEFPVSLGDGVVPLAGGVRRVVVDGDAGEITVHNAAASQVVYFGRGRITAADQAEAAALAGRAGVVARAEGDTLFISLSRPPEPKGFGHYRVESYWTLLVPADTDLDMSGSGRVNVVVNGLAADWSVKAVGAVAARLGPEENLALQARARSTEMITGTIPWELEVGAPRPGKEDEHASPGPVGEERPVPETAAGGGVSAVKTAVFGQGRFKLRLHGLSVDVTR